MQQAREDQVQGQQGCDDEVQGQQGCEDEVQEQQGCENYLPGSKQPRAFPNQSQRRKRRHPPHSIACRTNGEDSFRCQMTQQQLLLLLRCMC